MVCVDIQKFLLNARLEDWPVFWAAVAYAMRGPEDHLRMLRQGKALIQHCFGDLHRIGRQENVGA
jgi:hypothetical protein